jgi:hypothetical protein
VLWGENPQELLRTPGGVSPSGLEQRFHDRGWCLVRARMRSARALLETDGAFGVVAGDPLVGDSSTDAKASAELREREEAALVVGDEAYLLVHGRRPAPRHAGTSEGAYGA